MICVECVLGIDGGSSAVRAALVDLAGNLIGFGFGGPANPKEITLGSSIAALEEAVGRAWTHADAPASVARGGYLGIAGLSTVHDRKAYRSEVLPRNWVHESGLDIGHHLDIALAANVREEQGIILVVGTGSACFGVGSNARQICVGGWGHFIDDPGSGYWLGLQAMQAAIRSFDGRGERTELMDAVQRFFRLPDLRELPSIIYNPFFSRDRIAELAPIVFEQARGGDIVARSIIEQGMDELALMVKTVAESAEIDLSRVPVSVTGGVCKAGDLFWNALQSALSSVSSEIVINPPKFHPIIGAVILAMRKVGITLDDARCENLSQQIIQSVPYAI